MAKLGKSTWGPAAWTVLHVCAANVDGDAVSFRNLLRSFSDSLPCPECRRHMQEFMENDGPEKASDKVSASLYVYRMHNWVNRRLGKKEVPERIVYDHYRVPVSPLKSSAPNQSLSRNRHYRRL